MVDESAGELSGWKILREMMRHIWPSDQPSLKARVVIAVGLLVGAKVRQRCDVLASEDSKRGGN